MEEWSSESSRDVHDTLAEMDRRLGELQRDLAGVSSRSGTDRPPAPPPPPPQAREDLRGVEERLSRIAEEARQQADALAKRIDDLTGLRDELERSAAQLADAAERARRAQGRAAPAPPAEEPPAEEMPPPTTTGESFTSEPTPPSWLGPEAAPPLEPATPPVAEEPSVVDDGVEEKAPSVEEPLLEPDAEQLDSATAAEGRTVSLDAGPFADIVALSAFEEMLDRLPSITEVYVRGLEGSRALIDLRTTAEGSIVEEVRAGVPLVFSVARDEPDALTINVEGIAPI
jgi:uncharacterized coiled-coil protein SlyX